MILTSNLEAQLAAQERDVKKVRNHLSFFLQLLHHAL